MRLYGEVWRDAPLLNKSKKVRLTIDMPVSLSAQKSNTEELESVLKRHVLDV